MGNESYVVDSVTGKLATEFTPEQTKVEKNCNKRKIYFVLGRQKQHIRR